MGAVWTLQVSKMIRAVHSLCPALIWPLCELWHGYIRSKATGRVGVVTRRGGLLGVVSQNYPDQYNPTAMWRITPEYHAAIVSFNGSLIQSLQIPRIIIQIFRQSLSRPIVKYEQILPLISSELVPWRIEPVRLAQKLVC